MDYRMAGVTDLIGAIRRRETPGFDQRFAFQVLEDLEALQPRGAETFRTSETTDP